MPRVSVVMPCYNAAEHIGAAIDSVMAQTYADLELVIVDDGSSDASVSVVEHRAARDTRLRLIRQQNRGAGPARNCGLAHATGTLVAFLDADDYWSPLLLERLVAALDAHAVDLAYCGWQNIGVGGGRGQPYVPPDYSSEDLAVLFLGGCRWPIHAVVVQRHLIDAAGGFDERYSSCMDYDLWLRMAPACRVVLVPEVLAFYRHHGAGQITRNRTRVALNHYAVQQRFLRAHPAIAKRVGRRTVRRLTLGELRKRGFLAYWARDLTTARILFRRCLGAGYFEPGDLKYMLPSLMPLALHRRLLALFERPAPVAQV